MRKAARHPPGAEATPLGRFGPDRGRTPRGAAPSLPLSGLAALDAIITAAPCFLEVLLLIPRYAATDLPVLIKGEPGTGKELVAEALWALSPRRHRLFHRLNCATLAPELATSELFGHQRGAFTGAQQSRPGKFRLAQGGTLFLDEVGDLPLSVQPRLLRAVEQGEIEPVGGDGLCRVDVRLIAATNQNLDQLMTHGRFRQDLYDRLAVLEIHLPPLRERGDDVFLLAQHFLEAEARRYERPATGFSSRALRRLTSYSWPGNVRELRNVITRAVLFSCGPLVEASDLLFPGHARERQRPVVIQVPPAVPVLGRTAPEVPAAAPARPGCIQLEKLLQEAGGNVSALARRLQVCTRTVYRWFKACGLDLQQVRGQRGAGFAGFAAPPAGDPLTLEG